MTARDMDRVMNALQVLDDELPIDLDLDLDESESLEARDGL